MPSDFELMPVGETPPCSECGCDCDGENNGRSVGGCSCDEGWCETCGCGEEGDGD